MIKFVRNTLIILLITIAYGLVMLHYGQKKFYEWDNEKQLNYLNKEPANYNIFSVHPDSIVAPIKSKKLYLGVYLHPDKVWAHTINLGPVSDHVS